MLAQRRLSLVLHVPDTPRPRTVEWCEMLCAWAWARGLRAATRAVRVWVQHDEKSSVRAANEVFSYRDVSSLEQRRTQQIRGPLRGLAREDVIREALARHAPLRDAVAD